MPTAPAAITSPKIKKLAQRALKSPSMLTTAETREMGASVMAHLLLSAESSPMPAKKPAMKKSAAKKSLAKHS